MNKENFKTPLTIFVFILCILFFPVSSQAAFPVKTGNFTKFKKHSFPRGAKKFERKPTGKELKKYRNFKNKHGEKFTLYRNPGNLAPSLLAGKSKVKYSGNPKEIALKFITENKDFLQINPAELKYEPKYSKKGPLGVWHIYFGQIHRGLEVIGAKVTVHLKDGYVNFISSSFASNITVSLTPTVSASQAEGIVVSEGAKLQDKPELKLFYSPDGNVYLVWQVKAAKPGVNQKGSYLVDAHKGEILVFASSRAFVSGNVKGEVYETFPNVDYEGGTPPFGNYVQKNFRNQYVWLRSYQNRVTSGANGNYSFSIDGKIFAALQGPYFTVVNHNGESAYYTNASSVSYVDRSTFVDLPPGSGNYADDTVYSSTVTPVITETYPLAMTPVFDVGFSVGDMDIYGAIIDDDYVSVSDPDNNNRISAIYRGTFPAGIFGPFVIPKTTTITPRYSVKLITDEGGQPRAGFTITNTRIYYFSPSVSPTTLATLASYNFVWSPTETSINTREEANVFYHLNEMRNFFQSGVNLSSLSAGTNPVVGLNNHIPVAVRASGNANPDGMWNAFYDLQGDYMMIGGGPEIAPDRRLSFALDGALVRHEYVHGVVDKIFPIWYFGESGAISEGLSDYWSLSSLRDETSPYAPKITTFGEFFSTGLNDQTLARNLKDDCGGSNQNCFLYPQNWESEVHNDGRIVGQILWSMRDNSMTSTWLGNVSSFMGYSGPRSDLVLWHALLYFPDTLHELREAMITVCQELDSAACDATHVSKISTAFNRHGVTSPHGGDMYEPNDGPDEASDISGLYELFATIYSTFTSGAPSYDIDYYSLPLSQGKFKVTMTLPHSSYKTYYHAYMMILLSPERKDLRTAHPVITNSLGYCPDSGECLTRDSTVTLEYDIETAGRYILMVSAGPNFYYYNGPGYSLDPYHLKFDYDAKGSANALVTSAIYDNDVISFSVPYTKFYFDESPYWDSTDVIPEVEKYHYTQLLDQDLNPIPQADTLTGTYVADDTPAPVFSGSYISGKIKILSGFHARYPAVGTVYLKIYGITREGEVLALGISDAVNLTANTTGVVVWNNIMNLNRSEKAVITYSLLTAGDVDIKLYTRNGFRVKDIYNGYTSVGINSVSWDGRNNDGKKVASGMYLLVIEGPGIKETKKVVVVK